MQDHHHQEAHAHDAGPLVAEDANTNLNALARRHAIMNHTHTPFYLLSLVLWVLADLWALALDVSHLGHGGTLTYWTQTRAHPSV